MSGTSQPVLKDKEIQVEIKAQNQDYGEYDITSRGEITPEKQNQSNLTLEDDANSVPVSVSGSPAPEQDHSRQNERVSDPSLHNSQIVLSAESCEVIETDAARGAEVLRTARASVGMPQAMCEPPQKSMKIVTFNLNESHDQKQPIVNGNSQLQTRE